MSRAINLDKLKAQEQKAKEALAVLQERQADLQARKAELAQKLHQERLLTLGQLVEDTFGASMSMVEIAEILQELQGGMSSAVEAYGVASSSAPSRKTETPAES